MRFHENQPLENQVVSSLATFQTKRNNAERPLPVKEKTSLFDWGKKR